LGSFPVPCLLKTINFLTFFRNTTRLMFNRAHVYRCSCFLASPPPRRSLVGCTVRVPEPKPGPEPRTATKSELQGKERRRERDRTWTDTRKPPRWSGQVLFMDGRARGFELRPLLRSQIRCAPAEAVRTRLPRPVRTFPVDAGVGTVAQNQSIAHLTL